MPLAGIDAYPRRTSLPVRRATGDALLPAGVQYFVRGRYALFHGLRALAQTEEGRTVLLPAWHCRTQVLAVQAAGLRWRFFPVDEEGRVDMAGLTALLDDDVLAVSLTHYYGWPAPVAAVKAAGCRVIEDCAHALGGPGVGGSGDLAIYSLRKSLPVPDGGALRVNRPRLAPPRPRRGALGLRPAARAALRSIGADDAVIRLRQRWRRGGDDGALPARPGFHESLAGRSASLFTRLVVRSTPASALYQRRRAVYRDLRQRLADHPRFAPLHPGLPPGICPLALVIRHLERDRVAAGLAARGIETFCFGRDVHESLDLSRHPGTACLLRETLALPVHQDLGSDQIDRIAGAVLQLL